MCCVVLAACEHCYWAAAQLLDEDKRDERQRALGARGGPGAAARAGTLHVR